MATTMAAPLTLPLERTDSHPSLTHSTSSDDHLPTHRGVPGAGSEALLTPTSGHHTDLSLTRSTSDLVSSPDAELSAFPLSPQDPRGQKGVLLDDRGRKKEIEGRLWSSKSSSALRSKSKDKKELKKGRGRSATVTDQPVPPPPISIPRSTGVSPPQTKSAGTLSSFFKKLTGRSSSVPKKAVSGPSNNTSPKSVPALPVLQAMQSHTTQIAPTAPMAALGHSRQRSRASVSESQARSPVVQQGAISASVPTKSHMRSPSNISARSNRSAQNATSSSSPATKQTALPLSTREVGEPVPATAEREESISASSHENFSTAPTDGAEPKKSPMKRNRASFTLASTAAPIPAPEPEAEEPAEEMEEVDSEAEDDFHDLPSRPPLEPIVIPRSGASRTDPPSAVSGMTATTATSEGGETLVTPNSPGTSPSKSPPKYDPIVDSPPKHALGRKESKWRKSLMGLGVAGKPQKQPARVTRRISSREPPTSYDAYLTQQKRIASNRQSCQPTIHTAGSVAAETRGLSKEEQDAAETFFLS